MPDANASKTHILDNPRAQMFFASCLALFLELAIVRWLGSEIHIFAFLGSIPLITIFFALGLGAAIAKPRISIKRALPYVMPVVLAFFGMTIFTPLSSVLLPTGSDTWVWNNSTALVGASPAEIATLFIPYLITLVIFLSITFVLFFGIGEVLREKLGRFSAPLDAYAFDLAGSIIGVLAFTAMSFLQLSPVWWALFSFLVLFLIIKIPRPAIIVILVAIIIVWGGTSNAFWSPYYMIQIAPNIPVGGGPPDAINLYVNQAYFHQMINLSSSSVAEHATDSVITQGVADYDFPYRFVTNPGNVLVVGAGAGNDVASALRHGATHVDVVEIDPKILQLGEELHPEQPYEDPRVTLHVDDARSFLETTNEKYNTIIYGLLDSHASISSYSDVRLDNFVYTEEGFVAAKSHLAPGGNVIMSFAAGDDWLLQRIATMLKNTYGETPLVFHRIRENEGGIFIVGSTLDMAPLKDPAVTALQINFNGPSQLPIPTDDWPYLYLEHRAIPGVYLITLLVVLVLGIWLAKRIGGMTRAMGKTIFTKYASFFFLGAAFLLIEIKSIDQLSVLFGSTWIVNAAVIFGILLMAFLANALVKSGKVPPRSLVVIGLFVTLGVSYFINASSFAGATLAERFFLGGCFAALPLFFSGLLFSELFRKVTDIPSAFGANLVGAFVGGLVENVGMITGIRALAIIAALFYCLAIAFYRPEKKI
jgi:spermidine synthase